MKRTADRTRLLVLGKEPLLLLLVLALAAVLRALALGSESLWLDEAVSVEMSGQSLTSIVDSTATGDTNPPLYYMLLHVWTLVFGESEVAVRSLSACLGAISVVLVYKVGGLLFDRRVGVIAALLLAISPYAIYYSQEARHYSLLLLLTLLSYLLFVRLLRADRRSTIALAAYTLVNIMLCYTHIFGVLVVGSQILYFLLFRGRYPKVRPPFWASQAATLVAFSPWVFVIVTRSFEQASDALEWIPEPSLLVVAEMIGALGGAGYLWRPLGVLFILVLLGLCLAGILGSAVSTQRNGSSRHSRANWRTILLDSVREPRIALLLTWFFFPLIVTVVVSLAVMSLLVSRYLIGIAPAIYLLTALGISTVGSLLGGHRLRANIVVVALIALVVVISIPGLHRYYAYPEKSPWRDVAGFVEQEASPGDAIVFVPPFEEAPFAYYYGGDPEISVVSSEAVADENFAATGRRVWLVLGDDESRDGSAARQQFFFHYGGDSLMVREEFDHTAVYLFARTDNRTAD